MINSKTLFKAGFIVMVLIGFLAYSNSANAANNVTYTAPDGLKIISYSDAWSDESKLQAVYKEVYSNTHGEEFSLLSEVRLFPGPNREDNAISGKWNSEWDKSKFNDKTTIDIYNCDKLNSVEAIAPVIAHEYGHLFTFYYYFKFENKSWEEWRTSKLAVARGLQNYSRVSANAEEHRWRIQEIVADDYVQLFSSPKAKLGWDFPDILEGTENYNPYEWYNIYYAYNFTPQENYELPLAANMENLKDYWLAASGLSTDDSDKLSHQANLKISEVKPIRADLPYQYIFSWDQIPNIKEYTLLRFELDQDGTLTARPVKTVEAGEKLSAAFGSALNNGRYFYETMPTNACYFVLYMVDDKRQIVSSEILGVDFKNELKPDTFVFSDEFVLNEGLKSPKVKINGKQMNFEVPPIIEKGRTLVPLRAIFEELGASIQWDEATQTITANTYDMDLKLTIGNNIAFVNGKEIKLDVSPEVVNGRTLVPLRFVSESLGADVRWNDLLKLAIIDKK